jgi:hypothetical protein
MKQVQPEHREIKEKSGNRFYLVGEIVETYERDGKNVARISLKSMCVDVHLDSEPKARLGDTVVIDAGLIIRDAKVADALPEYE